MSRTFSVTQTLLGYLRRRTYSFRLAPVPESAWLHREREADGVVTASEKLQPSDHPLDTHCRCGLRLGLMPAALQAVSRCWINTWSFLWSQALAPPACQLEAPMTEPLFSGPGCFLKTSCLFSAYAKTSWSLTHRPCKDSFSFTCLPALWYYPSLMSRYGTGNVSVQTSRSLRSSCYFALSACSRPLLYFSWCF